MPGLKSCLYCNTCSLGVQQAYKCFTAIARGYCRTDREAHDEMVHIWKSTDDYCLVSIQSMRSEESPDRQYVDYAISGGFEQFSIPADDTRPGPLVLSGLLLYTN